MTAGCGTVPPALEEAQLCELWIAHSLREISDADERRLVVTVECAPSETGEGYVLVTLSAAEGEEPLADPAIRALEGRIARALDAEIERRGWRVRYPTLTVQVDGS